MAQNGLSPAQRCVKMGHQPGSKDFEACVARMESKSKQSEEDADKMAGEEEDEEEDEKDEKDEKDDDKKRRPRKEDDEMDMAGKGGGYPYPYPYPYPQPKTRRITQRGQVAPRGRRFEDWPHPVPKCAAQSDFSVKDAKDICAFSDGACPIPESADFAEAKKCAISCRYAEEYGCPVFFKEITPMKFEEIQDVEIFATGTHRGETFTKADLEKIAENFKKFKELVQPPLVLGHDENQEILQNSGLPAAGWLDSISLRERDGMTYIVGRFTDVPKVVKDVIERRAYKRISAEIYKDFEENGVSRGLMIRRVGLLGADIPEVKSLSDVVALYDEGNGKMVWAFSEGASMKDEKKATGSADSAVADRVRDLEKKNEELTRELARQASERERVEIDAFVERLKRDGRFLPAWEEMGVKRFISALDDSKVVRFSEKESASPRKFFEKFLSSMPPVVRFDEIAKSDPAAVARMRSEPGSKNAALSSEAEKLVSERAKAGETITYAEAVKRVARARPELVEA